MTAYLYFFWSGFSEVVEVVAAGPALEYTAPKRVLDFTAHERVLDYSTPEQR